MKLIIEDSKEKMSESAMQILLGTMMQDKRVNISLTAGRSPELLYKMFMPIEFISLLWTIGKPLMNRFVMPEKSMQC